MENELAQVKAWNDDAFEPEDIGYFSTDLYLDKSPEDKMADLWQMVTADTTVLDYYWADFTALFTQSGSNTMTADMDEMPR